MAQGENAAKPHANEDWYSRRLRGRMSRKTWWKRWTHRIERRNAKRLVYSARKEPTP